MHAAGLGGRCHRAADGAALRRLGDDLRLLPRLTQFGRALHELNIDILYANSSQAKGRVERMNKTLQDRLMKELRLESIDTLEDANVFLPGFIDRFNEKFAKQPASDKGLHRPLTELDDLDEVLCWQ